MKVQFAKWGNSLALRIPRSLAREIRASEGRMADVTVQKGRLVVAPVDEPAYDLDTLLKGMGSEHVHGETATGSAVGNEFA
jgi:antitoxin MazE